jgi:hypothetical protein
MKVELRRLRLNQGGYTDKGEYFGTGAPLFEYRLALPDSYSCNHLTRCSGPDVTGELRCPECNSQVRRDYNDVCTEIRAQDREHAKEIIRRKYPEASFYR